MTKDSQIMDDNQLHNNSDIENKINEPLQPELPSEPNDPIAKLEEDLAIANDKYLRLFAEFENYKKRIMKERLELLRSASTDVIISILPVLDDFDRAANASPLPEGIALIYNKMLNILNQKGLKVMESKGNDFDPELHDAITNIPVEDASMKNKVVDEVEKGYYLNDKVIRHAKVIVGN